MARQYLPLSKTDALAERDRISRALGYPKAAQHIGPGNHATDAEAATLYAVAIEEHPTDPAKALLVMRDVPLARFRAGDRAAIVATKPAEFVKQFPADAKAEADPKIDAAVAIDALEDPRTPR